jgi:hypothetical protein
LWHENPALHRHPGERRRATIAIDRTLSYRRHVDAVIQWLLFLHVASVLAFLLGHGVQVGVMWRQRQEADPRRNLALFEVLPSSLPLRILGAGVVFSGLLLTAAMSLWGRAWIWLSIVALAAIWVVMWRYGGQYYNALETAGARTIEAEGTADAQSARAAWDRARLGPEPAILTIVGLGGLLAILWLMMFRPF